MGCTYSGRDVSGVDLLSLLDGQLRPELQVVVGELDVVCVVVAGVVDEAVDWVEGHPLDARLVAVGLQLHPVGPEDPDHPAHLVVAEVVHLARLLQQQHHVQHLHAHVLVSTQGKI